MLALYSNLQRLLAIRGIVFVCQLLALLYSQFILKLALPYIPVWSILIIFVLINIGLIWRLRQSKPVTETEFLGHLLLDVIGLGLLIYFTGGASNPFISYLLVPIMISATTLSWRFTWSIAAIALLTYTTLLFWYQPLSDLMPMESDNMGHEESGFSLHILGMWFNFLVSAGLITYFVVKMAGELRSQQSQLASLRESTLRGEQILGIATQAAGTAHQMGTPLSTMAILLKDMLIEENDAERKKEIEVLIQQVGFCRDTLKQLVSETDLNAAYQDKKISLKEFFDQLIDQWQLLKPEVQVKYSRSEKEHEIMLNHSSGLQQAIVNLLNNAAEAGGNSVQVKTEVTASYWSMQIIDQGPGLTDEVKARLGSGLYSTKETGLGMGFMLSHATVEQLGGTVSLEDVSEQGGTLTRIQFPRNKIIKNK